VKQSRAVWAAQTNECGGFTSRSEFVAFVCLRGHFLFARKGAWLLDEIANRLEQAFAGRRNRFRLSGNSNIADTGHGLESSQ
jgi:hypothetical protein